MTREKHAAMLSAFVFPGAGQLYLARRVRGVLLIAMTLAAIVFFMAGIIVPAQAIMDQMMNGTIPFSLTDLFLRVRALAYGGGGTAMNVAAGAIVACWVGSIADAWCLRR